MKIMEFKIKMDCIAKDEEIKKELIDDIKSVLDKYSKNEKLKNAELYSIPISEPVSEYKYPEGDKSNMKEEDDPCPLCGKYIHCDDHLGHYYIAIER